MYGRIYSKAIIMDYQTRMTISYSLARLANQDFLLPKSARLNDRDD